MLSISIAEFAGELEKFPLPYAHDAAAELRATLADLGYAASADPAEAPTAEEIGQIMTRHLNSLPELSIVHVLSHGHEWNGTLQVYGSDGVSGSTTSLTSWMNDATAKGTCEGEPDPDGVFGRPPSILFFLDICGAGTAARQEWQSKIDDERRNVWVIAGSLPRHPSFNARFTRGTAAVLRDLASLDVASDKPHIPLDVLARAIRRQTARIRDLEGGYNQQVVGTRVDITADVVWPPFFDNPAYEPSDFTDIPVDLHDFVEVLTPARSTSDSRDTGRETVAQPVVGQFHGRGTELRALTQWLGEPVQDDNLRVVVGSPGAGKSALIAMIVCAAHTQLSDKTRHLWWDRRTDLPSGMMPNLAAVSARERDAACLIDAIGRQLHLPPDSRSGGLPALLAHMAGMPQQSVVCVDSLDESVDPREIVLALADFVNAKSPRGAAACRVLLGTRSGPDWPSVASLITAAEAGQGLVNLDKTPVSELRGDLRDFVEDVLRGSDNYGSQELYEVRKAIAEALADRLTAERGQRDPAARDWGEFLVASLATYALSRMPVLTTADEANTYARSVPRDLPGILDLDLRTTGGTVWKRPVLAALAHSFGAGMPLSHLVRCVGLFAPSGLDEPTEADILNALREARFYVRRHGDSDQVNVYRLFHQSLADHLFAEPR